MVKKNEENNIINFKRHQTKEDEEAAMELATKVKVIDDLANEGIISQKERLRIIKKLID